MILLEIVKILILRYLKIKTMETRSSSKRKNTNEVFLSSTKQRNVQHFTIYDDEDFYEELPKTLKKSNIGDIIIYLTKNQLGCNRT